MKTSVTKKGQTKIPAAIRKRHHIKEGDRLVWLDDGEVIRVVPMSADPITALRGSGQGEKLLERLLQNRHEDQEREDWARLSAQALEAAYGEDEPEYSLELVKRPNPEYDRRGPSGAGPHSPSPSLPASPPPTGREGL